MTTSPHELPRSAEAARAAGGGGQESEGGKAPFNDHFILAGREFASRLLVGTGKYADLAQTRAAVEASGAEIVTVSVRRMDLSGGGESLQTALPPERYTYLPNSAGCYSADEAVRTLRLARELGGWDLVKLEVIGDKTTLLPDEAETLRATEMLVAEGFYVMVYTTANPALARQLENAGAAAIMPLASPIGSGLGITDPDAIASIVAHAHVPVLVDAGIGAPSDATLAMELGCAGVLLNTAIAKAGDPVAMAQAFKLAVQAGRGAFLAKPMARSGVADASSPQSGLITLSA
jgi:thiazole synthase